MDGYSEKDELLTHFQDLTGNYDVDHCLQLLESSNWNMDDAIQLYFNQQSNNNNNQQHSFASTSSSLPSLPSLIVQPLPIPPTSATSSTSTKTTTKTKYKGDDDLNVASTAGAVAFDDDDIMDDNDLNQPKRYLEFEIEYKHERFKIKLTDLDTIKSIKKLCQRRFNINVNDQSLKGWKVSDSVKRAKFDNNVRLGDLNLAYKTTLYLINNKEQCSTQNNTAAAMAAASSSMITIGDDASSSSSSGGGGGTAVAAGGADTAAVDTSSGGCYSNEHTPVNYELCIIYVRNESDISNNNEQINLNYESNKTFLDLKNSIYKLKQIKVADQKWWSYQQHDNNQYKCIDSLITNNDANSTINLCDSFNNNALLYELCRRINNNKHKKFYLFISKQHSNHVVDNNQSQKPCTSNAIVNNNEEEDVVITDDDDEDDDDDLIDIIDIENDGKYNNTSNRSCLLPKQYDDEIEAIEYFINEYEHRYGKEAHTPPFYIGTLFDALNRSLFVNKLSERKLFILYVHVDRQLYSNLFNTNLMCKQDICNYLKQANTPYLIWPWDITETKDENYLFQKLDDIKNLYGFQFNDLDRIKCKLLEMRNKLPCLIVLERLKTSIDFVSCIDYEKVSENDVLMLNLIEINDDYEMRRDVELKQEQDRERREQLKREQDLEFQRSLDLDKAKKELKLKEEQQKKQIEQDNEKRKADCAAKLPPEPSSSSTSNITTIRFRKPSGEFLIRKFLMSEKLNVLLFYMDSLGYFYEQHKLLQTFPRRDLTQENHESTLDQLKLHPQETLIIEQR